jgi:hypothetical protein
MSKRIEVTADKYGWLRTPSYTEIVETFGEVLVQADEANYQGDSLYLIRGDQGYGYLVFGWGSCSGCDALEACESQADVDELQDDLERGIKWFPTLEDAKAYVTTLDKAATYIDADLIKEFQGAVEAAST